MNLKKKLLKLTRSDCKKHNIRLYLGKGRSVRYFGITRVNGFFDFDCAPKRPKLACAIGKKNWELTLVHERSHLHQWLENCPAWAAYVHTCTSIIERSMSGEAVDQELLTRDARITMTMERDCEMRSHQALKELGYSKIKLDEYVQKANAYTMFYLYIAKHRKWYKIGSEPYTLRKVWSRFPKRFNVNIDSTFARLEHLYDFCVDPSDSK